MQVNIEGEDYNVPGNLVKTKKIFNIQMCIIQRQEQSLENELEIVKMRKKLFNIMTQDGKNDV